MEKLEPRVVLSLIISEFAADNSRALDDEDGNSSDWLEVHNPTSETVDLEGWYLTDNADDLRKWEFPSVDIEPGEYLVVFASEKDRDDPDSELHTNFRLDTDGEYLALVQDQINPELPGTLIPTVVHEYGPVYPEQVRDITYGFPTGEVQVDLVSSQTPAQLLVPGDDSLGRDWTTPEFEPGPEWTDVTPAIGYDTEPDSGDPVLLANSQTDWSTDGTQGLDNWTNGYYNLSLDGDGVYQSDDFIPFPRDDGGHSATNAWTGSNYDWYQGNPPWTTIGSLAVHPNGNNNGNVHWVMRRWESEIAGSLDIFFQVGKQNAGCGNGVTGRVFLNGTQLFTRTIAFNDSTGFTEPISVPNVELGDLLDFAILPDGTDGTQADGCDGTNMSVTIEGVTNLLGEIETDVESEMHQQATSAYLRIPFEVEDVSSFDRLTLLMRYDGGFSATLNGQEVAAVNAPPFDQLAHDSEASAERSDSEAISFEQFNVTSSMDLLSPGTNVLAIHGLNSAIDDPDFFLDARLVAGSLAVDLDASRYFPQPTPGAPNGVGQDTIGPIVSDSDHTPHTPRANEDLVVTTHVAESFAAIDSVTMRYRVMFGGENAVPMTDDGQGADEAAGDGIYTAVIPSSSYFDGQMIRWYFTATDVDGTSMRWPLFETTTDSDQYLGTIATDPSVDSSNLPVLHLFVQNTAAADTRSGTRASIFYLNEFYDNILIDLHGQSSGGFPKKSYDLDFNKGNRFLWREGENRVKDVNILSNWADKAKVRNTLGYEVYRDMGMPYHYAFPVRIQRNATFFATADMVEDGDDRYLERVGLDPRGALYKIYNTMQSPGDAASAEKKSRREEPHTDLEQFIGGIVGQTPQAQAAYIFDNVDVPETVNFLAGFVLTSNRDCCHKNFYVYRDSEGNGEWQFLPWDVDLSFGHNWRSGPAYFDNVLYANNGLFTGTNNGVMSAIYNAPGVREMYLRRVRTLMDELLQPPGTPYEELKFEARMDELVQQIDPNLNPVGSGGDDADLDYIRWGSWSGEGAGGNSGFPESMRQHVERLKTEFFAPRRQYLYNSVGEIPDEQPDIASLPAEQRGIVIGAIDYAPRTGNQDEEFIEIRNENTFAVDISGWQVSGAVEHTFTAGTVLPADSRLFLSPDITALRARRSGVRGGLGLFMQGDYQGHLSSFGETIVISDQMGREILSHTYVGNPSDAQQYLRISEINYNPPPPTEEELAVDEMLLDRDFEFLEFVNTSDEPMDLNGVSITDGVEFTFGAEMLDPGERILVVQNEAAFQLRYGDGFRVAGAFVSGTLDNAGEGIKVEDALGGTIQEFEYNDSDSWPQMADGLGATLEILDTQGDYEDGANWRDSSTYGGSPGAAGEERYVDVVVNEVLSHTDPPQVDSIELHNTTDQPIDVGGWYLSDSNADLRKFRIPDGTMIDAGGYVVFDETHFNPGSGADPDDFALDSAEGDEVWLTASGPDGRLSRFADDVEFGAALNGESLGRWPNGLGELIPMTDVTLGAMNSGPRIGPVIINEVMYNPQVTGDLDPQSLEYVELRNTGGATVELEHWQLADAVEYTFSAGQSLGPQGILVLVSFDVADADALRAFRDFYAIGDDVTVIGPFSGSLNNAGERVRLLRADDPPLDQPELYPLVLEDEVAYAPVDPWPESADGLGHGLHRGDPAAWGMAPASWTADGGSPGSASGLGPTVRSIGVNLLETDPEDLAGRAQPTSWAEQRSDVRSIVVQFTEPIAGIDAADLVLTNLGVNAPDDDDAVIPLTDDQVTFDGSRAIITFGAFELPEGVLRLEVMPTVTDVGGTELDGDQDGTSGDAYVASGNSLNRLYRLTADYNGDQGVSIFDFSTFSYWFGYSTEVAPEYADLDMDAGVSIFDFNAFAANFGVGLVFDQGLRGGDLPSALIVPSQEAPSREELRPSDDDAWRDEVSVAGEPVLETNTRRPILAGGPRSVRPAGEAESVEDRTLDDLLELLARDVSAEWHG